MEKGGPLWAAGLTAAPHPPEERPSKDIAERMRDILGQLGQLLRQACGGPQDVVKTVALLLPLSLTAYRFTAAIQCAYFQRHLPGPTGVLMEALPQVEPRQV